MKTGIRRYGVTMGLVVGALVAPASAGAAVQIGTTFPGANLSCGDNFTALQTTSAGGSYAAPSAGVITSWSVQPTGAVPIALKLKFGRAAGGNDFTIVGDSPPKTPTSGVLNTFTDVRIPVQPGDVIGYYADQGPMATFCGKTDSNFSARNVSGDQAPGTTTTYGTLVPSFQISFSALLEPDCDGDGFGDETQDADISSCSPQTQAGQAGRNVVLDANKNKVKKGRRVTLTGQLNQIVRQGPCESGQAVELQRKKPSQSSFTTIQQLQTDAGGGFSTKRKVKKTFEYRAQVSETATCGAALSNTEKVKVKKKKKK
jgi:hypothetical protein